MELKTTVDILQTVSDYRKAKQIVTGFAIETENWEKNALQKLQKKKVDAIVLNNPLEKGAGFNTDTNIVTLYHRNGKKEKFQWPRKRILI